MSGKKDKGQASDRIQSAALSAATKGLSRPQAERVTAAAARNVNAYGQKEEGPSRWQERKEAKRQMYLRSTEKAVILGVKKDKANDLSIGGVASQCQKCFQAGHWTYECKNERVYVSRPSRSQLLKNPKLRQKIMASFPEDNPDIKGKVEEKEYKVKKRRKKSKRKHRSDTDSSSNTEASDSGSDSRSLSVTGSDYSSDEDASSYSSSSDSEEDRKRKKRNNKKQKRRRKKYSSSSESSGYDSSSDSDSKRKRYKSKKRSSKC